jgi:hypothetical protein
VLLIELLLIALLVLMFVLLRVEEIALKRARMPRGKIEKYWDGSERRRHVRLRPLLEVRYRIGKTPSAGGVVLKDISECGLRLLVDKKLERGTTLDVELQQPSPYRAIPIHGVVVWCNEAKDKGENPEKRLFHVGIRFLKVKGAALIDFENLIRSLEEGLKEKSVSDGNTVTP